MDIEDGRVDWWVAKRRGEETDSWNIYRDSGLMVPYMFLELS